MELVKKTLWVPLSAALVGGCLNDSSLSSPTGGLDAENSQAVGARLHDKATDALYGMGTAGGGGDGPAFAGEDDEEWEDDEEYEECWTVSGDTTDADGDEIPLDATYTFDCAESDDGWSETYSGTVDLEDTSPDAADYAFDEAFDLDYAVSGEGYSASQSIDGTISSTRPEGAFRYETDLVIDYAANGDGEQVAGGVTENLVYLYTPDEPFVDELVAGTYTIEGTWSETFDGETVSTEVSTPDPLVIDPSCESAIVSGTLLAVSGDGSITVTWNACDDWTVTYDGT